MTASWARAAGEAGDVGPAPPRGRYVRRGSASRCSVVVVVASRELHEHAVLVTDAPGVVAGRQHHHVAGAELLIAPVVHAHVQATPHDECDVRELAGLGARVVLEVLRPARAGPEGDARDRYSFKLRGRLGDASVNVWLDLVQVGLLHHRERHAHLSLSRACLRIVTSQEQQTWTRIAKFDPPPGTRERADMTRSPPRRASDQAAPPEPLARNAEAERLERRLAIVRPVREVQEPVHMVISGGTNIYPVEIEACLLGLDGVRDVAVVGIPDDEFGEALAAHVDVEPSAALTEDAVREHVRARLAGFKVPRVVVFDHDLPREETGKIFKRRIRRRYWEHAGR